MYIPNEVRRQPISCKSYFPISYCIHVKNYGFIPLAVMKGSLYSSFLRNVISALEIHSKYSILKKKQQHQKHCFIIVRHQQAPKPTQDCQALSKPTVFNLCHNLLLWGYILFNDRFCRSTIHSRLSFEPYFTVDTSPGLSVPILRKVIDSIVSTIQLLAGYLTTGS